MPCIGLAEETSFTASQVCRAVGISYRQLDYWDKSDLVIPTLQKAQGKGSVRLYSFTDLVALRAVRRLEDGGISLQTIRKAIKYLQANLPSVARPFSQVTLVTDGNTIFALCQDNQQLIDTLKGGQLVFALALEDIVKELERSLLPSGAPANATEACNL
ncbi:MAG: MerR family transcriptional regulator [Chloroflexota bacterium]|nr:MerR family transcriptional regulator [Chloroflexota bacterium]